MSPLPMPRSLSPRWIAAVPDESASAPLQPVYPAISLSNASTWGPSGAIQLVSNAFWMYSISRPVVWGGERYTFLFNIFAPWSLKIKLKNYFRWIAKNGSISFDIANNDASRAHNRILSNSNARKDARVTSDKDVCTYSCKSGNINMPA